MIQRPHVNLALRHGGDIRRRDVQQSNRGGAIEDEEQPAVGTKPVAQAGVGQLGDQFAGLQIANPAVAIGQPSAVRTQAPQSVERPLECDEGNGFRAADSLGERPVRRSPFAFDGPEEIEDIFFLRREGNGRAVGREDDAEDRLVFRHGDAGELFARADLENDDRSVDCDGRDRSVRRDAYGIPVRKPVRAEKFTGLAVPHANVSIPDRHDRFAVGTPDDPVGFVVTSFDPAETHQHPVRQSVAVGVEAYHAGRRQPLGVGRGGREQRDQQRRCEHGAILPNAGPSDVSRPARRGRSGCRARCRRAAPAWSPTSRSMHSGPR